MSWENVLTKAGINESLRVMLDAFQGHVDPEAIRWIVKFTDGREGGDGVPTGRS